MKSRKNGKIEVFRLFFALVVVLHHANKSLNLSWFRFHGFTFFNRGYLGVEFFFLLTGYFMGKTIDKQLQQNSQGDLGVETAQFAGKKFKAVWKPHMFSFIILFIAVVIIKQYDFGQIWELALQSLPSFFFIQKTGFQIVNLNNVEWYISCMLLVVVILYPLCKKYYSMFVHVIGPMITLFGLGYLVRNYGTFSGVSRWNGVMYTCLIRCAAEISLGIVLYEIVRQVSNQKYSHRSRVVFTIVEWIGWILAAGIVCSNIKTKYEVYMLVFTSIALVIVLSNLSYGNELWNNKFCYECGTWSLYIYLSQQLALEIANRYFVNKVSGMEGVIYILLITMANAALCRVAVYLYDRVVGREKVE